MPAPVDFKYRAFLSYAHADARWAAWLHKRLERFPIDKDLVGRITDVGPVPERLAPIFRDRDDFAGGHALTDATIAALDASAALIVLCSPVAATRPAVNEEVRLFRWRHPGRPVIPVIIGGSPNSSAPLLPSPAGRGRGWGEAASPEAALGAVSKSVYGSCVIQARPEIDPHPTPAPPHAGGMSST